MPPKCTDADSSKSSLLFLNFYMDMPISGKPVFL